MKVEVTPDGGIVLPFSLSDSAVTSIMEKAMREGNSLAYGSTYTFILTEE